MALGSWPLQFEGRSEETILYSEGLCIQHDGLCLECVCMGGGGGGGGGGIVT